MTRLSKEDRAGLNALLVRGQHAAARCTERLLMDGETILTVLIAGTGACVSILPPGSGSPLWADAGTYRTTATEISFVATRFGVEIRWTMTRAEAELRRISGLAGMVH